MVEELSADYANYLLTTNINREIRPLCGNIDEMMLRLDELENLLHIVQNDGQNTRDYLPQINAYKKEFQDMAQRVDAFEDLLRVINRNLSNLEQHVETAGEELGYTETGLMGLLKPLFKEQRKAGEAVKTNLDGDMNYVPCEVFKAEDYFPDSSSC